MRKLGVLFVLVVLPLALTGTAVANTTNTTVFGVHETETFGYATSACGFQVDIRTDGTVRETDYLNECGALVKVIFTNVDGPMTLVATNPATGKSSTSTGGFSETITFDADGTLTSDVLHGVIWDFRAPGGGALLQWIGNVDFSAFDSNPKNTAEFCDFLAGP
jgi:hypothetical protein